MAFDTPNFRQAWSAETTLAFLRKLTIGSRMNAAYEGNAMNNRQVFAQNPNYNIRVTEPERKANWGTPTEPSASRITINVDQTLRTEETLYVQDQVDNVVMDYRNRLQQASMHAMRTTYEDNLVAYMLSLTAGTPGTGTSNGNAGAILELSYSAANTGFSHETGKLIGNNAAQREAAQWVLDFFTDARVQLFRDDVDSTGGSTTIGGSHGQMWAALPVELYSYGLARALEDKGVDLDFTRDIIRDLAVFGNTFMGHYRGFDIFVTNSLQRPASTTAGWSLLAGADAAVAAPMRPIRNYVRLPENAEAERYEFRHASEYARQLINSKLLVRGRIGSGAVIA